MRPKGPPSQPPSPRRRDNPGGSPRTGEHVPTERKRLTLIPDLDALAVLGRDIRPDEEGRWQDATTAVNGALKRYALLSEQANRELDAVLTRAEWNLIADVNNGCADLYDYAATDCPALVMIRANVVDGDRLEGAGKKWGVDVPGLVAKLDALTPLHGEAIADAVRWFWSHPDLDHAKDHWWLAAFRRRAVQE